MHPDQVDETVTSVTAENAALEVEKTDALAPRVIDRALEKKLLWKLDTRVIPLLTIMYLFWLV